MVRLGRRWSHRGRVIEALLLVSLGGLLQRWVPMSRWAFLLGDVHPVPASWGKKPVARLPVIAATPQERAVVAAVRSASRRLPWEPTCLAEALAGQVMLRRRGEPGAVVIGLRRPGERAATWAVHAWLLGDAGALLGARAAEGYTAASVHAVGHGWDHVREPQQ